MIFKLIRKLEDSGDLKRLTNAGLISTKLYTYKEVYMDYDKNVRTGMSRMEALWKTAIEMKVSEALVYRAKNLMES